MALPHTFPSLLNTSASASVLLVGAGMSARIAPSVRSVEEHIRANHADIVAALEVDPSPPPGNDELYDWAERACEKLQNEKGLTEGEAKLRLAKAVGVTTDPNYRANVATMLRSQWPRHRVAARFAREGRWRAIWSLNWDCVLESALECVGLRRHPAPGTPTSTDLPWNQWYCAWSPGDAFGLINHPGTIYFVKPHGCVNKLLSGQPLFVIRRSELQNLSPSLQAIAGQMHAGFSNIPLVTVGWKAEEHYIHDRIAAIQASGTLLANEIDRLSIINRTWYPADATQVQHNRLAAAYGMAKNECFFSVSNSGEPEVDDLFVWLQTRYVLLLLERYAQAHAAWNATVPSIQQLVAHFSQPHPGHQLNHLVDDLLPTWVRFCFNAKRVTYWQQGVPVPEALVATILRDEHIPWGYSQTPRPDLFAFIQLAIAIWQKAAAGATWDFDKFPGAIWKPNDGHLIVPMPAWGAVDKPIEIAAIKPLTEDRNWPEKGAITRLSILPLNEQPGAAHYTDPGMDMRLSLARQMRISKFADPANIHVIPLADI